MKKIKNCLYLLLGILFLLVHFACSDEKENIPLEENKEPSSPVVTVPLITDLKAESTLKANELFISWTTPPEAIVVRVTCTPKNESAENTITTSVQVKDKQNSSVLLTMKTYDVYLISAVVIDNYRRESESVTIEFTPAKEDTLVFLQWADELMTSVIDLFFGKSSRDCWNGSYPNATGPWWDGDAMVWGQGSGFSGYVALRGASLGVDCYEDKYVGLTDRMYTSINRFITTDNNRMAYAVYPDNGNDRFYDDNVWIGLDMANLYEQTNEVRFLDKAVMVWDYLMAGYDETCGGGIYWKEMNGPSNTKHTCSTAPTAVLGCKLYQITKDVKYLNKAKELYEWLLGYLQDPVDHLFWDNINPEMVVSKIKYSYNAGQPMLAACLLYRITGESSYLDEARAIAQSAFRTWLSLYTSDLLHKDIYVLNEGESVWFCAVMLRGFVELYKLDPTTKDYIISFAEMMKHVWLSDCRNQTINLLNYGSFKGDKPQSSWEILHEAACVEMLAHLAALENEGLLKN